MVKLLNVARIVPLFFLWVIGNSQQPVLVVKSFEYIGQRDFSANDSAKALIKNSFARAIHDRWDMVMPEVSISAGPSPRFNLLTLEVSTSPPKFDTRLKDKKPGNWYLFLQVLETQDYSNALDARTFYTILNLKCRLINGTDGSLVIDRNLRVDIRKEPTPADQILLIRLPAYPASFVMAFDSIAKWVFQPEPVNRKSLILKPACVFQELAIKDKPFTQLSFKSDNEDIHHLTAPAFSFHTSGPIHQRIAEDLNKSGNIASSALTLTTGLHSSKTKLFIYRADFTFTEADSIYHCYVGYVEKEIVYQQRERTNGFEESSLNGHTLTTTGSQLSRDTDSTFLNVITLGEETLATFHIRHLEYVAPTQYNKMWNGNDSTTIMALPPEWNNKKNEISVVIKGNVEGNSFEMKTSKDTRIKEFYINDQLVTIMQGKDKPSRALVFHPISSHQLKLFTILSSLPYADFNSIR